MSDDGQTEELGLAPPPLVLDLDKAILKTDLVFEGLLRVIKRFPFSVLLMPLWLLSRRVSLRRRIAEIADVRTDLLPLNRALVAYASERAAHGQAIYIATAADEGQAWAIAERLGFISGVIVFDDRPKLNGAAKAQVLADRFPQGFVYAGASPADLAVWRCSKASVFAGRSRRLEAAAARAAPSAASFRVASAGVAGWLRAVRVHQWAKNALIFVPLLLSGKAFDFQAWRLALAGFVALSLVASATYLLNDLLDLQDDRQHWSKKDRLLANGELQIPYALAAATLAIVAGVLLAGILSGLVAVLCLLIYLVATGAYSLAIKRLAVADVLLIGGLFSFRLLFGAVLVHAPLKPWLFIFSSFLFTSLAMTKRMSELHRLTKEGSNQAPGRAYSVVDLPVLQTMAIASGMASVLVMVLFLINEASLQPFYRLPQSLFAGPVVLTLWLGRMWLLAGRGEMNDDPVSFAITDKVSLGLGLALALSLAIAILL